LCPIIYFHPSLHIIMSSSFFIVLLLACLLSLTSGQASAVPGVTLQLFSDAGCQMNISDSSTLVSPISTQCQQAADISYILICTQSSQATAFVYAVFTDTKCSTTPTTSITASGQGGPTACLPTVISQDGRPFPIPLYAHVTCSLQAEQTTQTTPTTIVPQLPSFLPSSSTPSRPMTPSILLRGVAGNGDNQLNYRTSSSMTRSGNSVHYAISASLGRNDGRFGPKALIQLGEAIEKSLQ